MAGCCDPRGCDGVFGEQFAAHQVRRYRRRGLDRTERVVADLAAGAGLAGAAVLEVGGGAGQVQVELLRRGAASATNLELVDSYDELAGQVARDAGVADRVRRLQVDVAVHPEQVEPADVVVLHRVVCCYPDYERLLGAAADHTLSRLVFSFPPRNLASRGFLTVQNLGMRVSGRTFRAFAHPPAAMLDVLRGHGLRVVASYRGPVWQVAALERPTG